MSRQLAWLTSPARWPLWPFLPVVRRIRGEEELGVLFDAFGLCRLTGFSACVFLTNLFTLPPSLPELLALPKEVFDTPEELIAAGWRVD